MALWKRIQQIGLNDLGATYGDAFPLYVRHYLAYWIEYKIKKWIHIQTDNPSHVPYAANILQQLLKEIEEKINSFNNDKNSLIPITKLQEASAVLQAKYQNEPLSLIATIRSCLEQEKQLIRGTQNVQKMEEATDVRIASRLEDLKTRTEETKIDLREMISCQQNLISFYDYTKRLDVLLDYLKNHKDITSEFIRKKIRDVQVTKEQCLSHLTEKTKELISSRIFLDEKLSETISLLEALQMRILQDELVKWKKMQISKGKRTPENTFTLDQIQIWCESLAKIIRNIYSQVKECEGLISEIPLESHCHVHFSTSRDRISKLLFILVSSTLIVETQPPQVLKKNTLFKATVRLLVGKELSTSMTLPNLNVTLVNKAQVQSLPHDGFPLGPSEGVIINSNKTMEWNEHKRTLSVTFSKMKLDKFKRAENRGTTCAMDEKFALLFWSTSMIGIEDMLFPVHTLSLPVVLIVHGTQEPQAWATILWNNAFNELGLFPFQNPEEILWPRLAEVLNWKFEEVTGKGLSDKNLDTLASKLSKRQDSNYDQMLLSWSTFCKITLQNRTFTFWDWFYGAMKVVRDHMKDFWMDNLIIGFVGRQQSEQMLQESGSGAGTVLLRFSDSELGGVTIAWLHEDFEGGRKKVSMIQPFTSRDFETHSLRNRLSDISIFRYIYTSIPGEDFHHLQDFFPNIPKEEALLYPIISKDYALKKYLCKTSTPVNDIDYIQTKLNFCLCIDNTRMPQQA